MSVVYIGLVLVLGIAMFGAGLVTRKRSLLLLSLIPVAIAGSQIWLLVGSAGAH